MAMVPTEHLFFSVYPVMSFNFKNHPLATRAIEIIDSMEFHTDSRLVNGVTTLLNYDDDIQVVKNEYQRILNHPALLELRKDIEVCVNQYNKTLNPKQHDLVISNSWTGIMGYDGYVKRHDHRFSPVSGSLYLRAPPGAPNLYFADPLTSATKEINTYEGGLILFPGNLPHGTRVCKTEGRSSIVFDTTYNTTYR